MSTPEEKKLKQLRGLDEDDKLSQEYLDKLVHDYKAHEASAINNAGRDTQIAYVLAVVSQPNSITVDGVTVYFYRSDTSRAGGASTTRARSLDGQLVVDIDSSETEDPERDTYDGECPKVRIYINEARVFDGGHAVPEEERGS